MMLLLIVLALVQICGANLLYKTEGDLNFVYLVEDCGSTRSAVKNTLINSAIWTTNRLNDVHQMGTVNLGISVFGVCHKDDYFNAIFKTFEARNEDYLLGFIVTEELGENVQEFLQVLNQTVKSSPKFLSTLLKATVKLLEALNWLEDVVVLAPNQYVLREFYRLTRKEWICVKSFLVYDDNTNFNTIDTQNTVIFLGLSGDIATALKHLNFTTEKSSIVIVPFDGEEIEDAPDGSYIIQPLFADPSQAWDKPQKVLPTPLLFEIANPILSYVQNISNFLQDSCNETLYKVNCIREQLKPQVTYKILPPEKVIKSLKIEPLISDFVYNIYRVENITTGKLDSNNSSFEYLRSVGLQNYIKVFTFNAIEYNLTVLDEFERMNSTKMSCTKDFERCILECENFKSFEVTDIFQLRTLRINLRQEPWVYAFISLSGLGVLFCLSVMIFIISRLCKKNVLEGNPILTIFLLLVVMFMFVAVVPFCIDGNKAMRYGIYLARSLCVTLPYTFAFALLLSRTILLATVSKEVGFMSHVAGTVQAFLCLFIFGVQVALSLQLSNSCEDVFRGNLLVYLLSYNVILLVLLIFIAPMVTKSQRNYREGKYFTISIVLIAFCWSCWLPGYAVLDETWKDPILCLGLVSTASILLGTIFIPRTYLMTVSAARERFTSALPSLATATSAMDIYRASTQPVYDCVNVAAINAANANIRSISGTLPLPHPDFYSSPDMPEDDDDFEVTQCDTPPPDKVTRF